MKFSKKERETLEMFIRSEKCKALIKNFKTSPFNDCHGNLSVAMAIVAKFSCRFIWELTFDQQFSVLKVFKLSFMVLISLLKKKLFPC